MRPLLIDAYCGAGGASAGYHRAGFEVIGIDAAPQPRYPYAFVQGDVRDVLRDLLDGGTIGGRHLSAVTAFAGSPPCQVFTKGAGKAGTRHRHADLIGVTRDLFHATGKPYVIENVEEADIMMAAPVRLCGEWFGLGVFRHRMFECTWPMRAPRHHPHRGRIGDGRFVTVTGGTGGRSVRDGIQHGRKTDWQRAMGIDWMTAAEMAQAIPPRYTAAVGASLMDHLRATNTLYRW